ncbi:hypothetical protein ID866_3005, partial [Astraeus odoratus]
MGGQPIPPKAAQLASRCQVRVLQQIERNPVPEAHVRRGGYAVVHQGTMPNGTKVAIKVICGELPLNEDATKHRNVLPLLGITFKFDYTVSMVSAWMSNGNACEYVQNASVDPRPLLSDIAKGLYYLHSHEPPVYHGDLKGQQNVLISDDGRALLTDFGLSFLVKSFESDDVGRTTSERDVWAFGMTALELFTRKQPFSDVNRTAAVMRRILLGPEIERPNGESTHSRLTDGWWEICRSCWEHDPSLRPKISEIVNKIRALEPSVTCVSDCVSLHELIPSIDRKLVTSVDISDHILSGLIVFARAVETSIKTARQAVPAARSILQYQDSVALQTFTKDYRRQFTTTVDSLKRAQRSFGKILSQRKKVDWELSQQIVESTKVVRNLSVRKKVRPDAKADTKERLFRVICTLEMVIDSIDDLAYWWTGFLGAFTTLTMYIDRTNPKDETCVTRSVKESLGQIIGDLELYEER